MRKSILFVLHDSGLRGAERMSIDVAISLVERGWEVTVLMPSAQTYWVSLFESENIQLKITKYYWWMGPGKLSTSIWRFFHNIFAILKITKFIKSHNFDLIYSHSIVCNIGGVSAKISGVPHIWHLHEPGPYASMSDKPKFDYGEWLSKKVIKWIGGDYIAVSKSMSNLYKEKLGISKIYHHYQFVGQNTLLSSKDKKVINKFVSWKGRKIIVVGSLVEWKDQITAIKAMSKVVPSYPDAKLFLIGNDPDGFSHKLLGIAKSLGVENNIELLGEMENAFPVFKLADCCIITAVDEGFGRVCAEAMLNRTPIIMSNTSVNIEVSANSALYYEKRNFDSLASCISTLFSLTNEAIEEKCNVAESIALKRYTKSSSMNKLEELLIASIRSHKRI